LKIEIPAPRVALTGLGLFSDGNPGRRRFRLACPGLLSIGLAALEVWADALWLLGRLLEPRGFGLRQCSAALRATSLET